MTRNISGCVSSIYFPNCVEDDTSYYSAIILEFVKNGEKDQTDCWFQVRSLHSLSRLD